MLQVAPVPADLREDSAHLRRMPSPPAPWGRDAAFDQGISDLSRRASAGCLDGLNDREQLKGSPIGSTGYLKANLCPSLRRYLPSATLCHFEDCIL
jgi:hypothetical protein